MCASLPHPGWCARRKKSRTHFKHAEPIQQFQQTRATSAQACLFLRNVATGGETTPPVGVGRREECLLCPSVVQPVSHRRRQRRRPLRVLDIRVVVREHFPPRCNGKTVLEKLLGDGLGRRDLQRKEGNGSKQGMNRDCRDRQQAAQGETRPCEVDMTAAIASTGMWVLMAEWRQMPYVATSDTGSGIKRGSGRLPRAAR